MLPRPVVRPGGSVNGHSGGQLVEAVSGVRGPRKAGAAGGQQREAQRGAPEERGGGWGQPSAPQGGAAGDRRHYGVTYPEEGGGIQHGKGKGPAGD